jgi:predicted nuclease of predicted toxin-antitoxin system
MRLILDENMPRRAVETLRALGHDVIWIRQDFPGVDDSFVMALAIAEGRICVTFDKDFGELATGSDLAEGFGVVLARLPSTPRATLGTRIASAIDGRSDWSGHISVVAPGRLRMRPLTEKR